MTRFIMAASLALAASAVHAQPKIEVGSPFPDIALPSLEDGSPTSITAYRGQKVVLHIFASW